MKIEKYVEFGQVVGISLSAEDISIILDEEKDDLENLNRVLMQLNNIGTYLKAVPESIVAKMNEEQKQCISGFLAKMAEKFKPC